MAFPGGATTWPAAAGGGERTRTTSLGAGAGGTTWNAWQGAGSRTVGSGGRGR